MKRKFFVPQNTIRKLFKEIGAGEVEKEGTIAMSEELHRIGKSLAKKSLVIAVHAKRVRIKKEDILFVTRTIEEGAK